MSRRKSRSAPSTRELSETVADAFNPVQGLAILRGVPAPLGAKPRKRQRRQVLEEMAGLTGDTTAPTAEGEDLFAGIKAEIEKLLEQFKAGSLDAAAVGEKVVDYLKAHEGLVGGPDDDTDDDDDDETAGDGYEENAGDKKPTGLSESEAREFVRLRREKRAVELLESVGVIPNRAQIRIIATIPTRAGRKSRAQEMAQNTRELQEHERERERERTPAPRTLTPTQVTEDLNALRAGGVW